MNLDLYKHIYFVGIGGIGMSALARYFNAKGMNVCGYDKVESDLCKELESEGISIHYRAGTDNIPSQIKDADSDEMLIVYTPAVSLDNKELQFLQEKGCKLYKRAEVLGMISHQLFTIAVAGTHGKTTTSTILAHILQNSGKDSTAFLGGISKNYNSNLLLAKKEKILIVEADEYDRSFLQLKPDVAIITSVDTDHMDVYKTKEDLHKAFIQFSSQIKQKGVLLVEESVDIDFPIPEKGEMLTYSATSKTDYYAENIRVKNGKTIFDLFSLNVPSGMLNKLNQTDIELILPGKHNISNAVAAACVCYYLGISAEDISEGIATFNGINRRFEVLINNDDLAFVDDYAHHPKEVSSTINAAKQLFPNRTITVVFQPHLYSRTQDFVAEFAISLSLADQLILLDIYPAREKPISGVNSQMLLDLCTNPKKETCSKQELLNILKGEDLDVLLTLGAGDIGALAQPIKYMLN
ncbi:UDP-N-acetylmuramate--L-alanine ligase [Flavobacteriales bacterium]|nr:UDP-N-acetylmuramate--L-alanine ligase [Flavobacteriales bacterium]